MTCLKHGYSYDCARCVREKYIKRLAEQAANHSAEITRLRRDLKIAEQQRDEALRALDTIGDKYFDGNYAKTEARCEEYRKAMSRLAKGRTPESGLNQTSATFAASELKRIEEM